MPFVWSIGTILGPAIGGTFADPHESFPNMFPIGNLFERFPYLLPNLICASLLLISIVLGYFLLDETHPDMQPRVFLPDDTYVSEETPLRETSDALKRPAVDLRAETYGTMRGVNQDDETWHQTSGKKAAPSSIFGKRIMALIIALSIFTYHSMTYDHLLPIFFEDDKATSNSVSLFGSAASLGPFYSPGGLGLSLRAVGMIMAVNGVIALFVQAVIFPIAAELVGVHKLFIIATVLHPIAYVLVPTLLYVSDSLLYPMIYFCLTVRNILSIIAYPLLLILIKEATPSLTALGKVNGLAASAGAACRMVAPPVAGYLYTFGSKVDCTALAWYGSALVAVIGVIQCYSVQRQRIIEQGCGERGVHENGRKSRADVRETFPDESD
jgi:hypothetical protein